MPERRDEPGGRARRSALCALCAALVCALVACGSPPPSAAPAPTTAADEAMLDELSRRTFDYFWETANPKNGLVPDRWPTPSFSSIAAVGFALVAYGIGAERGWVSRADARARTLTTLRFFANAPMGDAPTGMTGHRGFYYHFLDMQTGARYADVELSTIDTALLLAGVLFGREYFDGADPQEVELRALADELLARPDWTWSSPRAPLVAMGWKPESGFLSHDWVGYNEAMILYLLALASPTHPVPPAAWQAWSARYDERWGVAWGQEHLRFAPLFGHQYSHLWVDFRGIFDEPMRRRGIDYFENSRRATLAQRAYAIANPDGWAGYGATLWGLSACDGPGDVRAVFGGKERQFRGYAARGTAEYDDGTLAPTAMISSLPFAPEIVLPGIAALRGAMGGQLYGRYGFFDAFNPSFTFPALARAGRVAPGHGWIDVDYLGIDQGPILGMIENYRSELVWRVMRKSAMLRQGLARAGFRGPALEAPR